MARVFCLLPNASKLINGVAFIEHKLGMVSEEIGDDVAASFAKIPGYKIAVPAKGGKGSALPPEPVAEPPSAPAAAAEQPPADTPASDGAGEGEESTSNPA